MSKLACVAVVKDEERHIAEWIAYQFVIGFDTVILMDNQSTDGTAAQAARLALRHDVRVLNAPDRSSSYQKTAYLSAIEQFKNEFDWMAFFDADEFLALTAGVSLPRLLGQHTQSAAIGVNWAIFGSSGLQEAPTGLTIETYRRRSLPSFFPNRHVKSIVRPKQVNSFINGHCFNVNGTYRDLLGNQLVWTSPGIIEGTPAYHGGKLNHYFTRSRADWAQKLKRGYPDLERKMEEFNNYDLNEVRDDTAAHYAAAVRQILSEPSLPAPSETPATAGLAPAPPTLGIAITTYNRRPMLLTLIETLRRLTSCPFHLVICDDGSADGTIEAVQALGVPVVGGTNRGIAWNKNRGLFYLREIIATDVILLLDDDVMPMEHGWEQDWIAAAERLGHVNLAPARGRLIAGGNTPSNPGISDELWGQCLAFSRQALSYIGYMDSRFERYGHEHTDLTKRAIRAGFGGFILHQDDRRRRCFYSIEGGLRILPAASNIDRDSMAQNGRLLQLSETEPVYRNPWRSEEEFHRLRAEMPSPHGSRVQPPHQLEFTPVSYLAAYPDAATTDWNHWEYYRAKPATPTDAAGPAAIQQAAPATAGRLNLAYGKPATQSSISEWSRGKTPEDDAAGAVNGRPDGKRKFHTGFELNPWWQVDLGHSSKITEIRIFNTTEAAVRARFHRFRISIAYDLESWVDVFEKADDAPVGGIDGAPFVWTPAFSAWGRFVRITALGMGFLHLDQVQIFNTPADAPELSDAALFANFISLGDNCEFEMSGLTNAS